MEGQYHNLILTFHIFTIMVLTINIILKTCNTIYYYLQICCHNNIITKKFIFLTRDFIQELYVLPDDDKRYAIETCRSIESVLKK